MNNTTVMMPTSRIWLSRFMVSVTTLAKSSVSDVTRETILPEGFVSKNDMSRFVTAAKASSRRCSTTSPTTLAVIHCRTKLNSHDRTPAARTSAESRYAIASVPGSVNWSIPQLMSSGVSMLATEFATIMNATRAIAGAAGRK